VFAYSMQIVVAVLCQISFCFTCRINNILQCFSIVVGFDLFLLDCQFVQKLLSICSISHGQQVFIKNV